MVFSTLWGAACCHWKHKRKKGVNILCSSLNVFLCYIMITVLRNFPMDQQKALCNGSIFSFFSRCFHQVCFHKKMDFWPGRGSDLPFQSESMVTIKHEQNFICRKKIETILRGQSRSQNLLVSAVFCRWPRLNFGSYLQVTQWALDQWKWGKMYRMINVLIFRSKWSTLAEVK